MEEEAKVREIKRIRYITEYASIEDAKADSKRLGVYDAEFKFGGEAKGLMATAIGCLPKFLRDKWARMRVRLGMHWEVEEIDGKINFVFIPCDKLAWAFNQKGGAVWLKMWMDTKKEFERLGCKVVPIFVYADEIAEEKVPRETPLSPNNPA